MALRLSPHMTVMQNAAQKAARRLLRDFAEVEQLQVSVKGPSDFVSQADLRAEQTLKEELNKARPGYAFLMEESGASGSDNWSWRWVVSSARGEGGGHEPESERRVGHSLGRYRSSASRSGQMSVLRYRARQTARAGHSRCHSRHLCSRST